MIIAGLFLSWNLKLVCQFLFFLTILSLDNKCKKMLTMKNVKNNHYQKHLNSHCLKSVRKCLKSVRNVMVTMVIGTLKLAPSRKC